MLTTVLQNRSFLSLLALAVVVTPPALAQGLQSSPDRWRPKELVLLWERDVAGGKQALGVYGAESAPEEPGMWRVRVWDELPNNVRVRSETIRCQPANPMRITSDGTNLFLRTLNPGGLITPSNRLDHLVWWAICFPEHAGKEPDTLGPLARQLGYAGNVPESQQMIPDAGR